MSKTEWGQHVFRTQAAVTARTAAQVCTAEDLGFAMHLAWNSFLVVAHLEAFHHCQVFHNHPPPPHSALQFHVGVSTHSLESHSIRARAMTQ